MLLQKGDVYLKSVEVPKDELSRAAELSVRYVVTHLGSHLGHGKRNGIKRIIDAINESFSATNVSRFPRFSGFRVNPTDYLKYSFGIVFLTIISLH